MEALIFTTNNNQIAQVEAESFPTAPDLVWVTCPADCTTEWTYNGTEFSPPPLPQPPTALKNKATASSLLSTTDWTTIPDVANSANSPYLTNQAEFIAYRNEIRKIAVTPTAGDLVWAIIPTAVWN